MKDTPCSSQIGEGEVIFGRGHGPQWNYGFARHRFGWSVIWPPYFQLIPVLLDLELVPKLGYCPEFQFLSKAWRAFKFRTGDDEDSWGQVDLEEHHVSIEEMFLLFRAKAGKGSIPRVWIKLLALPLCSGTSKPSRSLEEICENFLIWVNDAILIKWDQ